MYSFLLFSFLRKKEEIEKHIQNQSKSSTVQSQSGKKQPAQSTKSSTAQSTKDQASKLHGTQSIKSQLMQSQSQKSHTLASESENNEFDVEEYEPEETDYKHISLATTLSLVVKEERPYYIALTDVPYPGEIDSNYNLKK